jgi:small subunit ribosomal protein S7
MVKLSTRKAVLISNLGKKFTNLLMKGGNKKTAEKILLETLRLLEQNAAYILLSAIKNVKPILEMRPIRVKGANFQVPIPVHKDRQISLAIKWIIATARKKKGKSMSVRLKDEILLAHKNQGESVKKKMGINKTANSHRAYIHYRWF